MGNQTGKYVVPGEDRDRIENIFMFHAPINDQAERYEKMRERAKELAYMIQANTPKSQEQSLALTKLEEVVFFANAAIARNEN